MLVPSVKINHSIWWSWELYFLQEDLSSPSPIPSNLLSSCIPPTRPITVNPMFICFHIRLKRITISSFFLPVELYGTMLHAPTCVVIMSFVYPRLHSKRVFQLLRMLISAECRRSNQIIAFFSAMTARFSWQMRSFIVIVPSFACIPEWLLQFARSNKVLVPRIEWPCAFHYDHLFGL